MEPAIPDPARVFLTEQIFRYSRLGYKVIIHPGAKITKGNMSYTGEATEDCLEIAIGGLWQEWLPILVHETCHLDQHIGDKASFDRAEKSLRAISSWLDRKTVCVSEEDFRTVVGNESDCEIRAVAKIREFTLPVDIPDYIRRANAYLGSYPVAMRHQVWIPQPYRDERLCLSCPSEAVWSVEEVFASPSAAPPDSEFLRLVPSLARLGD